MRTTTFDCRTISAAKLTAQKLIFVSLLLVPSLGLATLSGNEYSLACQQLDTYFQTGRGNAVEAGICAAFLQGQMEFHEILVAMGKEPHYCLVGGGNYDQYRRVVVKFIRANPAMSHNSAAGLILIALMKAFPPKRKSNGTKYCP